MKLKKKILVFLGILLVAFILISGIAYFVITSSSFLTGVLLPVLSQKCGIVITAEQIDLSLAKSKIVVRNLRIGKPDQPQLKIKDLSGEYFLRSILAGDIRIENVAIDGVYCNLSRDTANKWHTPFDSNLQSVLTTTSVKASPVEPKIDEKPSKIKLNFTNIQLSNGEFMLVMENSGTAPTIVTLKEFDIRIPEFKTLSPSKLSINSKISLSTGNEIAVKSGTIAVDITAVMNDAFLFDKIGLGLDITGVSGQVNNVTLDNNRLALKLDATGDCNSLAIERFELQQLKDNEIRTNITATAKVVLAPLSLAADLKIMPVSEEIVSIACNFISGYNPGKTNLSFNGKVNYSSGVLASVGLLNVERSGNAVLAGQLYNLPQLNCALDYNFAANFTEQNIALNKVNLDVQEQSGNALQLKLTHASEYCWSQKQNGFSRNMPEIKLKMNEFDLRLVQLFMPRNSDFKFISGKLNADVDLKLLTDNVITVDAQFGIKDCSVKSGDLQLNDWSIVNGTKIKLTDYNLLKIEQFNLKLAQANLNVLKFDLNGEYQINDKSASVKYSISDFSPDSLSKLPIPHQYTSKIKAMLDKLEPFTIKNDGDLYINLKDSTIRLNKFVLAMVQKHALPLQIALKQPYLIDFRAPAALLKSELTASIELSDIDLTQLNSLLQESGVVFNAGTLSSVFTVKSANMFSLLKLTGKMNADTINVVSNKKSYRDFSVRQEIDLELADFNLLKIHRHSLNIGVGGVDALQFSTSSTFNLKSRELTTTAVVHSLNSKLLDLVYPTEITALELDGKADITYKLDSQALTIMSATNIKNLESKHLNRPLTGTIDIDLLKNTQQINLRKAQINAVSDGKIVADLSCSGQNNGEHQPFTLNLTSNKLDVLLLQNIFQPQNKAGSTSKSDNTSPDNKPVAKNAPVNFDFGDGWIVNLDLNDVVYGDTINLAADGKISAIKNTLDISPMNIIINKSPFKFDAKTYSEAGDLVYAVNGNLTGLDIHPIIQPFVEGNMKNIRGIVETCEFNFHGRGISSPLLWDNLKGTGAMSMKKISVPNDFESTNAGRIIMFPVRVISQLQKINLNKQSGAKTKNSFNYINDFYSSSKDINFNTGEVNLESKSKQIHLNKCEFKGDFITLLSLTGYAGLGSDQRLKIKSLVNIEQLSIPVDINGTIAKPQADINATMAAFMKNNALNLLNVANNVGGILEGGGKDLGDMLKKTIEVINPAQNANPQPVTVPAPSSTGEQRQLITDEDAKAIEKGVKKIFNNLF